jgi:hypothetical protein
MRISNINKKRIVFLFLSLFVTTFQIVPLLHHHVVVLENGKTVVVSNLKALKSIEKSCSLCITLNIGKTFLIEKLNTQHQLSQRSILFRTSVSDIFGSTFFDHTGRAPPAI